MTQPPPSLLRVMVPAAVRVFRSQLCLSNTPTLSQTCPNASPSQRPLPGLSGLWCGHPLPPFKEERWRHVGPQRRGWHGLQQGTGWAGWGLEQREGQRWPRSPHPRKGSVIAFCPRPYSCARLPLCRAPLGRGAHGEGGTGNSQLGGARV